MEVLLENKAAIENRDSHGNTLLHLAINGGYAECVEALLKAGAYYIDAMNDDGCTPLHLACLHGHHSIVQVLVKAATLETLTRTYKGKTLLELARENDTETADFLATFISGKSTFHIS